MPRLRYDEGSFCKECSHTDCKLTREGIAKHCRICEEPIGVNNVPELTAPKMTPSEGDTETEFTFSVRYVDMDNEEDREEREIILKGIFPIDQMIDQRQINATYNLELELITPDGSYFLNFNIDVTRPNNKVGMKNAEIAPLLIKIDS